MTEERRARRRAQFRAWRLRNLERCKARVSAWKTEHPEQVQKHNARSNAWQKENGYPSRNNERRRTRYRRKVQSDLQFYLDYKLRGRLNAGLRFAEVRKSAKFIDLVGCSATDLKLYVEKKFRSGMSWDNRQQWELDHIRPLSAFDLTDPAQQKAAFHYTNLQPLWRHENRSKHNRLDWEPKG